LDRPIVQALIPYTTLFRSITAPDIALLGYTLRSLALADPTRHAALEICVGSASMLRLIRERGTIFELCHILSYSTPSFAAGLIAAVDEPIVQALIFEMISA